ncbi:MAG TPA: hypothetical protein VK141_10375, partial [Nitrosomonas sp.]|nr:hypothetical protein [Nitrosomonas sp.]
SLSTGESFLVMNGGHNRVDKIWFTLYKIPLSQAYKGTYNIEGTIHYSTIEGTYTKIDSTGKTIGTGNWNIARIYN